MKPFLSPLTAGGLLLASALVACQSTPDLVFSSDGSTAVDTDATVHDAATADTGSAIDAANPSDAATGRDTGVADARDDGASRDARAPDAAVGCDASMCCGAIPCSGTCDQAACNRCQRCMSGEQCCGKANANNSTCIPITGNCP